MGKDKQRLKRIHDKWAKSAERAEQGRAKSAESAESAERGRALLDPVADLIDKTEHKVAGVNVDALDHLQTADRLRITAKNLLDKKRQAARLAGSHTVTVPIGKATSAAWDKAAKKQLLKASAGKVPLVGAGIALYETGALINSKEQRDKAYAQSEEMAKRGYDEGLNKTLIHATQNGLQGFADPAGTIYGAGRGLKGLWDQWRRSR